MKSKEPASTAGPRWATASALMPSSMAATRRGVKLLPTMARMRVCRGGSMARKDMARWASGPKAAGSRVTP